MYLYHKGTCTLYMNFISARPDLYDGISCDEILRNSLAN